MVYISERQGMRGEENTEETMRRIWMVRYETDQPNMDSRTGKNIWLEKFFSSEKKAKEFVKSINWSRPAYETRILVQ